MTRLFVNSSGDESCGTARSIVVVFHGKRGFTLNEHCEVVVKIRSVKNVCACLFECIVYACWFWDYMR